MRIISYVLLILLLPVTAAVAGDTIVGSWSGTVYENKIGKYTVNVTIHPGASSGTVEFARYPCGGSLSLISGGSGRYLYQESLNFGTKKCLGGLQARLTVKDNNQVYFEELIKGSASVYGNLYRVGQQQRTGCIEKFTPYNRNGFIVFQFMNHCQKSVLVSVCSKSAPIDRAVFNPLSGTAPPNTRLEIQGGMMQHFHSFKWDEGKITACPFAE